MAVTLDAPVYVDERTVYYSWTSSLSGTPTHYVYRNGKLVETTELDEMFFFVEPDENLIIQVFDDPDDEPDVVYDGRLRLHWHAEADADYYIAQEYVDSAWEDVGKVIDDGRQEFDFDTRFLEDVTTHQFRVKAVQEDYPSDAAGTVLSGANTTVSCLMVRHPDVPDASYSYDKADGEVDITIS